MRGIIFRDTLKTNWKQIISWGFGMGFLGFYIVAISSDVKVLEGYSGMLELLPPTLLNLFGFSDASLLTSVEGFVSSAYILYAMLMLSAYSVMVGLSITAEEEDEGIMDMLLSLPISRSQVIIEKSLAFALISLGIIFFCVVYPVTALIMFNIEADLGKVILSICTIYPGILLITAITGLFGTLIRRKATAIGFSTLFIISSYFLNFLGNTAQDTIMGTLQPLSYFYHANGEAVILDTYNPFSSLVIIGVAIACVALSIFMFNQRDIGL